MSDSRHALVNSTTNINKFFEEGEGMRFLTFTPYCIADNQSLAFIRLPQSQNNHVNYHII
jgi:hypothetical protein